MQRAEIDTLTADLLRAAIHDLKGPSNRLRLLSQMIAQTGTTNDEDTRKLLGYIETSAAAIGSITEGLRSYLEICSRPLQAELLNLQLPLAGAIHNLQPDIVRTKAEITYSDLPALKIDGFLMTWVFNELLSNSLRFCGAVAPRVHIARYPNEDGPWFISVVDNGLGIESGMEEKIFRPFERHLPGEGTGLGLTISRRIVEMHGGKLWAQPRTEGAEFRFFIDA